MQLNDYSNECVVYCYIVNLFNIMKLNFLLHRDNLISLNKLDSVNGILLLYDENHSSIHSFSNEDTCPNRYSGLSGAFETCNEKKPWNPWGSQIMLHKWKFPIFLTTDNVSINEVT